MKAQQGTDTFWAMLTGSFFSTVAYLMGGVDNLLIAFAILMVVDYATGLLIGWVNKEISSKRSYRGIAKKIAMLLFVIVANQFDIILGNHTDLQLRYMILFLLIATEGISLTENFAKLGVPIPTVWSNALEILKSKSGEENNKEEKKDGTEKGN